MNCLFLTRKTTKYGHPKINKKPLRLNTEFNFTLALELPVLPSPEY